MLTDLDTIMPVRLEDPINRQHPLNRGRVGWWMVLPGWDAGRTWYDLMGLNPAILTSVPSSGGWRSTTRPGGFGSILFNGNGGGQALVTADNTALDVTGTGGITMAAWVYPRSSGTYGGMIAKSYDGSTRQYAMYLSGGGTSQIYVAISGATGINAAGTNLTVSPGWTVNSWNRIVVTYDGINARIYINGVLANTTSAGGTLTHVASTLKVGMDNAGGNNFYVDGYMDDVSVWSRPLSAAEVGADYNLSRTGYPGMLNRWPQRMVEGAGAAIIVNGVASLIAVGTSAPSPSTVLAALSALTSTSSSLPSAGALSGAISALGGVASTGGASQILLGGSATLAGVGLLTSAGLMVQGAASGMIAVGVVTASGGINIVGAANLGSVAALSPTAALYLGGGAAALLSAGNLTANLSPAGPVVIVRLPTTVQFPNNGRTTVTIQ